MLRSQLHSNVHKSIEGRQLKQKRYFDCRAKQLPPIADGEKVRVKVRNNCQPATVLRSHDKPRYYVNQMREGNTFRRNRRHLLKTGKMTLPHPRSLVLEKCSSVNSKPADSVSLVQSRALSPVKRPVTPTIDKEKQVKKSRCGRLIRPPRLRSLCCLNFFCDEYVS